MVNGVTEIPLVVRRVARGGEEVLRRTLGESGPVRKDMTSGVTGHLAVKNTGDGC